MMTWIKKENNMQTAKAQLKGFAWLLFDLLPISAGAAFKSVVSKKAFISRTTTLPRKI